MRKFLLSLKRLFEICDNTFYYYRNRENNTLVINAWMQLHKTKISHRNWGDELNYYLLKEMTDNRLMVLDYRLPLKITNIMCIGSVIEEMTNENSIIWGSGAKYGGDYPLRRKPKKICAVRGPLTRKYLLSKGVECPEIYGDPALLLPRVYKSACPKKYKLGIIPHYGDLTNKFVLEFIGREKKNVKLINMQNYEDWHEVIDGINACDFIISSSLHGLIIADAYDIPNIWVTFPPDKINGNGFKFRDYFASVKRNTSNPLKIESPMRINELLVYKSAWRPISFDADKLIAACPFKLNLQR